MKEMTKEEKPKLHVASCSFGKDSIATILLALEKGEPLDLVIFSEVMFCHERGISGEHPEHIHWVYDTAIPKLEKMGVKVEVLKDSKDFRSLFFHKATKGKRIGMHIGFPMVGGCSVNSGMKLRPIRQWLKRMQKTCDVIQYIGIAINEPERLERIHKYPDRISLLEKYGYTEEDAYDMCERYGLLSPLYQSVSRGGCWFCPSARISQFVHVRKHHPWLWDELREMSKTPNLIRSDLKFGMSFEEVERRMDKYEEKQNERNTLP